MSSKGDQDGDVEQSQEQNGPAASDSGSPQSNAGSVNASQNLSQQQPQANSAMSQSQQSQRQQGTGVLGQGQQGQDQQNVSGISQNQHAQTQQGLSALSSGGSGGGLSGEGNKQESGSQKSSATDVNGTETDQVGSTVDLALRHLKNSIRDGDESVLDELGWNHEQAKAFLDRWNAMQQGATSDVLGKEEYEQTLRSLGLRPDRVRSSRQIEEDSKGVQVESRRTQPPYEYRERFKAFMKGASSRQVDVNEQ